MVVAILGVFAMMMCMRRGWHTNMAGWTHRAANSFGPNASSAENGGPRELTAQQLAGTAADVTGDDAPVRTRRSRRANRRTSQISTHSLPVYMKEPGEREVVIFRGSEDMMEEPPTTTHVVMPSVDETAESPDSPDPSVEDSVSGVQARGYPDMPDSPHDMPLLDGDESRADMALGPDMDNSRARLINLTPRTDISRPSMDTLPATDENASSRFAPQTPDPRGEAPPYFEVVPLQDMSPAASPEIPSSHDGHRSPEPPAEPVESPRRRSGLFGLFHSRHLSRPHAGPEPSNAASSHRRGGSDGSNISTPTIPRPRSRAQSRAGTHRPSVSASGFSAMSRSRSRLLESPQLTSPSMISVNSISAPLTHTTVRTGFTYPRSGPTPEQIKLIASRDSFARFGVPYGQDAIAYHASNSRMDLPLHPPPDFEEVAGPSRSPMLDGNDATVVEEPVEANALEGAEPLVRAEGHTQHQGSPLASEPVNGARSPPPTSPVAADSTQSSDSSSPAPPSAPVSPPPGLDTASTSAATSQPAPAPAKPKSPPALIRASSRASSVTSFETAEESLGSASAAATPFASASSKATLAKLQLPTGDVTPTTSTTPKTVSGPSTPRIATSHLHENSDATSATLTPASPTSAATEVGRAL